MLTQLQGFEATLSFSGSVPNALASTWYSPRQRGGMDPNIYSLEKRESGPIIIAKGLEAQGPRLKFWWGAA